MFFPVLTYCILDSLTNNHLSQKQLSSNNWPAVTEIIRIILPHNLSPITLNLEQEDKVKPVPAKLISGDSNFDQRVQTYPEIPC